MLGCCGSKRRMNLVDQMRSANGLAPSGERFDVTRVESAEKLDRENRDVGMRRDRMRALIPADLE